MAGLIQLDALGPSGEYRARNRQSITDVTGAPVAELSLVPRLYVHRCLTAMRQAPTMPADQRAAALSAAAAIFASGTVNGMSIEEYRHAVSRVSGLPISIVRTAGQAVAEAAAAAYRSVQYGRPGGAVDDWRDPLTRNGRAVWTRKGDVFAVIAAGNHPSAHSLWLEALALGYRVAVRPSSREPFTPHRLISALRAAGFGDDQVVLLPTDHQVADEVVRGADLALVYGGDDVVRKYSAVTTVLPQGPGRSKILLTGRTWRQHLDTVVASISHEGGTACINTTSVFVEGDPTPVAKAIAERLSALPSLPPHDAKAVLPVLPRKAAEAIEKYLLGHAAGTVARLGGNGVVDDLGDGSAVLRPAVFQVEDAHAPQTGIELGFPCVWVAPWSPDDGIAPLRDTLVLTAITDDEQLIDRLLAEPTISNVYVGDHPTYWIEPGIPHDGYLTEFLMRTKAVIRS
jgi:acyl-CoA reductase-like NAD-dependent aldehyde dehydrogenase